jgi:hypothetical protein
MDLVDGVEVIGLEPCYARKLARPNGVQELVHDPLSALIKPNHGPPWVTRFSTEQWKHAFRQARDAYGTDVQPLFDDASQHTDNLTEDVFAIEVSHTILVKDLISARTFSELFALLIVGAELDVRRANINSH